MVERAVLRALADGKPYRNRGWWFPGALMPDFTNAGGARWWTEKRRYLLEELGVDGFKTDGGEHAWGTDLRYADGTHGGETNNRYPVLYGRRLPRAHALGRPRRASRSAAPASPGRPPSRATGPATRTRPGRRFAPRSRPGSAPARAGSSSGAGTSAGFSGPVPGCELYLRSGRDGGASARSCNTTPSTTTTGALAGSDAVERRRAAPATRECMPRLPPLRAAARAPRAVPRRAGCAARQRQPLMRALFFDVAATTASGSSRTSGFSATTCSSPRCRARRRDAAVSTSRPATGSRHGQESVLRRDDRRLRNAPRPHPCVHRCCTRRGAAAVLHRSRARERADGDRAVRRCEQGVRPQASAPSTA